MTLFTQPEATALARTTGFPVAAAKVMGAICMVESQSIIGGRNFADSTRIGDQNLVDADWWWSYNLPQIRSARADKGTGRIRDQDQLGDPVFAMKSAYQIWLDAGRSFSPWSTYNSGAYKAYLQDLFPAPPQTYIVIGGDSLSRIASTISTSTRIPVTWQELAAVNHIAGPSYTIYPGNHILYPWSEYTVVSGDNLTRIVATYGSGVTVSQVATYNQITDPNKIKVGQVIRIPRPELYTTKGPTSMAPVTKAPRGLTILGRQPAVYLGLVSTLLSALIATHILTWTTDQSAVVIAAVAAAFGLWQAWAVQDTRLSFAITFVKAVAALAVGFGLNLPADELGVVMTFVTSLLSFFLMTQTSPTLDQYPKM